MGDDFSVFIANLRYDFKAIEIDVIAGRVGGNVLFGELVQMVLAFAHQLSEKTREEGCRVGAGLDYEGGGDE